MYDLNYGQPNFRSRDSKKVQEIISEAGKGSYAALGVELEKNCVDVQRLIFTFSTLNQKPLLHDFLRKISDSRESCKLVHFV